MIEEFYKLCGKLEFATPNGLPNSDSADQTQFDALLCNLRLQWQIGVCHPSIKSGKSEFATPYYSEEKMNDIVEQHWNHGPHYQLRDSIIFITWRLAFTLPKHIQDLFKELSEIREKTDKTEEIELLRRQNQFLYNKFWEYDNALGSSHSSAFSLNSPDISRIVKSAFHFFDRHKYNLHAYCLMSNHVHIILEPRRITDDSFYNVSDIIQSLKRYTAIQINSHLDRKGQLWDDYYFDRIIRDSENYRNVVSYILNNPVKAGLVDDSNKWKDSYYNPEFIQM